MKHKLSHCDAVGYKPSRALAAAIITDRVGGPGRALLAQEIKRHRMAGNHFKARCALHWACWVAYPVKPSREFYTY